MMPPFLQPYLPFLEKLAIAVAIFVAGWLASKVAARLIAGALHKFDPALTRFLSGIARYAVLAAAVIASLGAVGIHTTSLVAIFASAGLAVGLALQGSLSNFA